MIHHLFHIIDFYIPVLLKTNLFIQKIIEQILRAKRSKVQENQFLLVLLTCAFF